MTENKAKTYSLLIKIGIGVILCVFAIILLSQYITLGNLNSKNDALQQEYSYLVKQDSDLTNQKEDIEEIKSSGESENARIGCFRFEIKKNNEILTSINGELNIFSACINAILMAFTLVYIKNFLKSITNQR